MSKTRKAAPVVPYPKKKTDRPDCSKSPFQILQGFHAPDGDETEAAGYPATSAAQICGLLFEVSTKGDLEYVARTFEMLLDHVSGDILNTVRGNAWKHMRASADKYPLPKWTFAPDAERYLKRVHAIAVKQIDAERKAAFESVAKAS